VLCKDIGVRRGWSTGHGRDQGCANKWRQKTREIGFGFGFVIVAAAGWKKVKRLNKLAMPNEE